MSTLEAVFAAAGRHQATVGLGEPDGIPTWQWILDDDQRSLRWLAPEEFAPAAADPPAAGPEVLAATVGFADPAGFARIYGVVRDGPTVGWEHHEGQPLRPLRAGEGPTSLEADLAAVLSGLRVLTAEHLAGAWAATQVVQLTQSLVNLSRHGTTVPTASACALLEGLAVGGASGYPEEIAGPGGVIWVVGASHAAATHVALAEAEDWLGPEVARAARDAVAACAARALGHPLDAR